MYKPSFGFLLQVLYLIRADKSDGYDGQKYEFSMVHEVDTHLTKRSLGDDNLPEYLNIELKVGGKPQTLRLQRNHNVDLNTPVEFEGDKREIDHAEPIEDVAMYQDVQGGAAMSVTNEMSSGVNRRTFEGSFQVGNRRYGIEPTSDILEKLANLIDRRGLAGSSEKNVLHRVYRLVEDDDAPNDYLDSSIISGEIDGDNNTSSGDLSGSISFESLESAEADNSSSSSAEDSAQYTAKRAVESVAAYTVEIFFVVDHTIWDYWMNEKKQSKRAALKSLKRYFAHQINGMDLAYKSIDASVWGFTITPYLRKIIIGKTAATSVWTAPHIFQKGDTTTKTLVDAPSALNALSKWVAKGGRTWKKPDHAILFTRYNLWIAKSKSDIGGYAPIGRVCITGGGISVQEERGIHSWTTSAHELAHNLGALHDGSGNGCSKDAKYIMAPSHGILTSKTQLLNAYMFSSCSVKYFKETLSGERDGYPRVCLTNRICKHGVPKKFMKMLPGKKYSLDEQCKMRYGDTYSWMKVHVPNDICFKLNCRIGNTNKYRYNNPGAADGSPCGKNQCCRHGQCVTNCKSPKVKSGATCEKTGLPTTIPEGCTDSKTMNCKDYPRKDPRACFVSSVVKTRCCKSCHKAGLVDPSHHFVTLRKVEPSKETCSDKNTLMCTLFKRLCTEMSDAGADILDMCPLSCGVCKP